MFCFSTLVASDELHTFSTMRRTRTLKCCSPFSNGEACPVDASECSFALRSSHLENWKYFHEFHVAAMRDDEQHFLGHLCQTQVAGCRFNP